MNKAGVDRFLRVLESWRGALALELLALSLLVFAVATPVAASTRFTERGVYMESARPGDTTNWTVKLRYSTPAPVGSLDMLFCVSPIPYDPCVKPPGLDVSAAQLTNQLGEIGFTVHYIDSNHITLSRTSQMISSPDLSEYRFEGIVNPTDTGASFSIRLNSYSSQDASGPFIDFGSVKAQVTEGVMIETQVPPMLIFCLAQNVEIGCTSTDGIYFDDLGEVDTAEAKSSQSQMAAGTNATSGFVIASYGEPPTAGTSFIEPLASPTRSFPGINQFGINLVENTDPVVGVDPEGTWVNAAPTADYAVPDLFMFSNGDVVAESSSVSLMKKFTVSYVVNVGPGLSAGVYTTTITFIASGRF